MGTQDPGGLPGRGETSRLRTVAARLSLAIPCPHCTSASQLSARLPVWCPVETPGGAA